MTLLGRETGNRLDYTQGTGTRHTFATRGLGYPVRLIRKSR